MSAAPEGADESLTRDDRLRRSEDYRRCYRDGRRRSGRALRIHAHPNAVGRPRIGITASRKVGDSVTRHRVKRRLREAYRRWPGRTELPPLDIVIHVYPRAADSAWPSLRAELERLLGELVEGPRP